MNNMKGSLALAFKVILLSLPAYFITLMFK